MDYMKPEGSISIQRVSIGELHNCLKCANNETLPRGYKTFSCSTHLSTKFQLLIKIKYRQIKKFLALSLTDVAFILLINVKVPTIVGMLTLMSMMENVLNPRGLCNFTFCGYNSKALLP